MALYMIGLGLGDEKDITLRALGAVRHCEHVYLECYTSKLSCSVEDVETLVGSKIILADREMVEKKADEILEKAKEENAAFLVVGDIFSATTHNDLRLRAIKQGIKVKLIHNTSIITAVGDTGMDLYKFGRVTTVVYPEPNFKPESSYDIIKQNKGNNLHTLCLLDIKSDEQKYMTIKEALRLLLDIEAKRKENVITGDTMAVGCARLGQEKEAIKYGKVKDLLKFDFGWPLHTLVFPAKLHFVEEEVLELFK